MIYPAPSPTLSKEEPRARLIADFEHSEARAGLVSCPCPVHHPQPDEQKYQEVHSHDFFQQKKAKKASWWLLLSRKPGVNRCPFSAVRSIFLSWYSRPGEETLLLGYITAQGVQEVQLRSHSYHHHISASVLQNYSTPFFQLEPSPTCSDLSSQLSSSCIMNLES